MSIAPWSANAVEPGLPTIPVPESTERPLHRIREVREQQGVTLRTAARRMEVPMEQVRRQEETTEDMSLSELYQWQHALNVPVGDLLVDMDAPLSMPVLQRARLLKMMKTARSIRETAQAEQVQRMANMLIEQLIEVMPELSEVSPWHSVGQRRTLDEMGRIVDNVYSDNSFSDSM